MAYNDPGLDTEPTVETEVAVRSRHREVDDVVSLRLERTDGLAFPPWSPGAHIDLFLPGGSTRQYSLCGDLKDRSSWQIAVLQDRAGRGGSTWIHESASVGTRLRVRGPRNNFRLLPASDYLFVAGGIGITPLLPMIDEARTTDARWRLVYGGRTASSMAFRDRLHEYQGQVSIRPQDETGLLDLGEVLRDLKPGTKVYCCGPEPLIDAVAAFSREWPEGTLQVERFKAPTLPSQPENERTFEVVCQRSGVVLRVSPQQSILSVAAAAGLDVEYGCQEGICGTCETKVLQGRVDHRDLILGEKQQLEGTSMFICVSRAKSDRLVLDL